MNDTQILQVVGLVTVLLYLLIMFLARAHMIAWNAIHGLEGRVAAVHADALALGLTNGPRQAVDELVTKVDDLTRGAGGWIARLMSSGGEENQGWEMIHHAEELLIRSMGAEDVQARLQRARADLATDDSPCGRAWRIVVDRHLDADGNPKEPWREQAARSDLGQIVEHCHRLQDESFRSLAELANKTQWLVVAGLIFIGATILLKPDAVPLLGLGAVGGLASRIRQISTASAVPTDYGAYWAPLFLAPVLGALLGWSGIYLLQLAGNVDVLNTSISKLLSSFSDEAKYGLAILFGFTEGAFNGVATLVSEQLKAAPTESSSQASATATHA